MAQIILDSANNVIQGDFDTATLSLRTRMQTSTTNATTGVYVVPNGSATSASVQVSNVADPTNASKLVVATNGSTDTQIVSGANGSGSYLPLSFYTNNDIRFQMGNNGELNVRTAPGTVSSGTSGQVLTSGGPAAGVSWTTLSGYAGPNYQAFTSPGTFTVPTGITRIKVTVIGAGGGGATYAPTVAGGGGGSGGLTINYITGLTPGGTAAVTVGTGGTVPGGPGGTSSFGPIVATTLTATGGTGASGASGGAGGAGTGYGVLVSGNGGGGGGKYVPGGAGGTFLTPSLNQSSTSAYSLYGQRGGGGSVAAPGPVATAGLVGGGGGGSGGPSSFPAGPGAAAGGNGLVLVEY
jgi:hypothetical protein